MNLRYILSFGLILFLIFSSLNVIAILPKSIDDDIWVDGKFEGIITTDESSDNIIGTINLGRSSTIGEFKANLIIDDISYEAKGWFRGKILFGFYNKGWRGVLCSKTPPLAGRTPVVIFIFGPDRPPISLSWLQINWQ